MLHTEPEKMAPIEIAAYFRIFNVYDDVTVTAPGCPPGGYAVLEYVDAPKLDAWLRDTNRPLDERLQLYRRFLAEWGRRHAVAIRENEPRLVHENGDGKHVLIMDDGSFLWFDFEMIYRNRHHVDRHVSHEIIQYLWYLNGNSPDDFRDRLLSETVAHYPDRERLQAAYDFFFKHPNLIHRCGNLLSDSLRDPAVPVAAKLAWIATYATATGQRHRRAFATSQTLLIHEHPGPKHVIVAGERLVSFDFEHAYLPGFPIMEAAAEEITNFLFALECLMEQNTSQFIETYVRAYGQGSLLSDLANCILYGRSRRRRVKRWANQRQQLGQRKTVLMQKVLKHLTRL